MLKKFLSLGLMIATMASSMTVFATTPADWALSPLNDAIFYGLSPVGFENGLSEPVSREQVTYITEQLKKQWGNAGLQGRTLDGIKETYTRGEVLEAYYLDLQASGADFLGDDFVVFMVQEGILKGSGTENYALGELCTVQEALVFAARLVDVVYEVLGLGTEGFLWEVSDEDNTVYLLGTVHIGKAEVYPLSRGLKDVLESVDKIAFEVDFFDQEGAMYLMNKQVYQNGETLADYVDENTYERTMAIFEKAAIPEEVAKLHKPWAITNAMTTMVAQTTETTEDLGAYQPIDVYVYNKAFFDNKEILEIEGYKFQADLFDQIPVEYQIQNLQQSLELVESMSQWSDVAQADYIAKEVELLDEWIVQMKKRDHEAFTESYNKDEMLASGDFMSKLLFEGRDEHMTEMVLTYLADETAANYLVAVGAGHMVGENGIVKALEKLGYIVKVVEK